jgi:hypothetical protein
MDSVILFVNGHTHEHVEEAMRPYGLKDECVSDGSRMFFFRRYQEWVLEIEPEEAVDLVRQLGGPVTAAFSAESRRGLNARFALETLTGVMKTVERTVLEDHFGGLWSTRQIADHAAAPSHDIFSLAERARSGAQMEDAPPRDL